MDMLPVGISKKYTDKKIQEIIDDDKDVMSTKILTTLMETMGYTDLVNFLLDFEAALNLNKNLANIEAALNEIEGGEQNGTK